MTTDDSPPGDLPNPTSPGEDAVREPTQSLTVGPDEQAAAALAIGTHNRPIMAPVMAPVMAIESPGARGKTPLPPPTRARRADEPADYLGSVLGSYRVIELLGKGGMGYVYRAKHVKLGREVALKLLRSDYASRRDAVSRFFQEARTVNRVRHRNIVDVTDFVELDDGTTYIVMELLTGTSLGAWAQSGADLARAIALLIQICDGLAAAHQVGVVHRDLKPDNVVVVPTPDGSELVKLLDFGVAKLLNRDDEDVGFQTAAGSVIGTPAYMSPEQAGGMGIDARSDIYSLGAIMYELFTGQPLFRGRSFGEYVRKHLTEMPVPPRETPGGAGTDPRLEALILRCLDKDPDQRFARISDLREALLHLLSESDAAAGLYPPSTGSLSGSGLRALRTPLPPIASVLPLPPPLSQSSPGVQSALPAAHSSGLHRTHAADPPALAAHSTLRADPQSTGASDPYGSGPYASGPYASGPYASGPYASGPYASGPYASGPYASGPHRTDPQSTGVAGSRDADAYAPGPQSSGPHRAHPSGRHTVEPHAVTAASAHGSDPYAAGPHSSGPHRAHVSDPYAASPQPVSASSPHGSGSAHAAGPHPSDYPSGMHPSGPHPHASTSPPSGAHAVGPHAPLASAAGPLRTYSPPLTLEGSYSLPPPLTLEGSYKLPAPPSGAAPIPWWLWFSGGVLALGVGFAAALWFARPSDPALSPRPAPTSRSTAAATAAGAAAPTPAPATAPDSATGAAAGAATTGATTTGATAPPAVHPALVEVRFDSTPSASVFADGQPTELCRTPCAFDIDPADGGPTDHRSFVVRRAGYVDRAVTVDLTGTQREFQVALQRAEPDAAHADGKDGPARHPTRRPARPAKKPGGRGEGAPSARPDPPAEPGALPDARPAKKPGPPIDPTDTLDPFRKK